MEPTSYRISKLIDMFMEGELELPEMQRNYVWKATQVRDLIDSLYRGYPSGSILLWETGQKPVTHKSRVAGTKKSQIRTIMLLDGQQRITSLASVLEGEEIRIKENGSAKRKFVDVYFNVDHPGKVTWSEENDEEEKELFFQVLNAKIKSQPNWISATKLFKEGVGSILKDLRIAVEDPKFNVINDRLNKLYGIKNYYYPIQILSKEMEYDEVTEVFIRVNSSGTRLRGTDLALAQVTSRWPGSMELFESFVEKISQSGFQIDEGFVVRTLVAITTGQSQFKRIKRVPIEKLKANWEITQRGIENAVNFLKGSAYVDASNLQSGLKIIPAPFLIIPLAYYGATKDIGDEDKKFLRWFYGAAMWGRYSGSAETKLDQDLTAIKDRGNIDKLLANLTAQIGENRTVRVEDIALKPSNSPFFMMMYVLTRRAAGKDWQTGFDVSAVNIGKLNKIEVDHIFPKSLLEEAIKSADPSEKKKMINEIANFGFLSKRGNLIKTNEAPEKYLPRLLKSKGEKVIKSHLIPTDQKLWSLKNYQSFLEARRKLIAGEINKFIKKYEDE